MNDTQLPLTGHLEELRRRLAIGLLAVGIAFAVCYPQAGKLFEFLTAPLTTACDAAGIKYTLIGTGVAEAFFTRLLVSFIAGVFLALPIILHQIWLFIVPGLQQREAKHARGFVIFGTVFFLAGAVFCYQVVFPVGFPFLLTEYAKIHVDPAIRISEYLSFSSRMLLAFGITFELPVGTFFLARIGLVTHRTLIYYARHAVLVLFVLSAILTPPDVVSQLLMAAPLLALYAISIGVAYVVAPSTDEEES